MEKTKITMKYLIGIIIGIVLAFSAQYVKVYTFSNQFVTPVSWKCEQVGMEYVIQYWWSEEYWRWNFNWKCK